MRSVKVSPSAPFALVLAVASLTSSARGAPPRGRAGEDDEGRPSLRDRVGAPHARALLVSGTYEERLRGLERLAREGTRESLDALASALDGGGPILSDPRTRLAAARLLAPYGLVEAGRRGLEAIFTHGLDDDTDPRLGALARDTAALALARAAAGLAPTPTGLASPSRSSDASPEERALVPLLAAAIGGGPAAGAAERALIAHPPSDLRAFVRGVATMTATEARLLGEFRDPRALGMLRRALVRGDDAVKDAALLSLAKLGDATALEPARSLARVTTLPAERRAVVAEALLLLGSPEGAPLGAGLLAEPSTRSLGLDLAERARSRDVLQTLGASALVPNDAESACRAIALLGRLGDHDALAMLYGAREREGLGVSADAALSETEAPGTDEFVAGWLERARGRARTAALRVALARVVVFAPTDGLLRGAVLTELERAVSSREPSEIALGWFGLTLLGLRSPAQALAHPELTVRAAIVAALVHREDSEAVAFALPLARRALAAGGRGDPADLAALGLVLAVDGSLASSAELADLAEASGALAPIAAYRLAARDPRSERGRIDALLGGTDVLVRAQIALGLGESLAPDAIARLDRAYRLEVEPEVRLAIVHAAAARAEEARARLLGLAAALDPDARVRRLAARAEQGARARPSTLEQRRAAWLALVPSRDEDLEAAAFRPVVFGAPGRPARLTVSAHDGVVLAFSSRGERVRFRTWPEGTPSLPKR